MKSDPFRFQACILALIVIWRAGAAGEPPAITEQPRGILVVAGDTLRLAAAATGTPPLAFIWQRDGMFLAEQTNATLVISNAQPTHSGRYRLTVSNEDGLARSDPADVIVYTNHVCEFPPSWVATYRSLPLGEAIQLSATQLGDGQALIPDESGNLYAVGSAYSASDHSSALALAKFDAGGGTVWVARSHPGRDNNGDRGVAVALAPSGNIVVAGQTYVEEHQVYFISKYSPDGAELWLSRFTNSCGQANSASPYSIAADEAGDVYVSGSVGVVKYNSEGDLVWASCWR
jgi:hypothetical protein